MARAKHRKSKWNYHDADLVDICWPHPDELLVTVALDGYMNRRPMPLIRVYFRGVQNRAEIEAAWAEGEGQIGVRRCIEGFFELERGLYLLGFPIRCGSVYEV